MRVLFCWVILFGVSLGETPSEHLVMGNPSNAKLIGNNLSEVDENNMLLVKDEYCLSYNNSLGTANWVSWHLSKEWLGKVDRSNDFRQDRFPSYYRPVMPTDYKSSGFDRGHICPSGDRTNTSEHNSITFLMTNMMPQSPRLNRGTWKKLEEQCRKLVGDGNELYVIAGPHGSGGHGSNGYKSRLATYVTVPSACWKVILVLHDNEDSDDDSKRVTKGTVCFAALFPNTQDVRSDWESYSTTVRDIEELTGFNFFSVVSPATQEIIESKSLDEVDL